MHDPEPNGPACTWKRRRIENMSVETWPSPSSPGPDDGSDLEIVAYTENKNKKKFKEL